MESEHQRAVAALRERDLIINSTIWRLTAPLRAVGRAVPLGLRNWIRRGFRKRLPGGESERVAAWRCNPPSRPFSPGRRGGSTNASCGVMVSRRD